MARLLIALTLILLVSPKVIFAENIDWNKIENSIQNKIKGQPVLSKNWMVSAANPYAVKAGAEILSRGGSAADAMVAIQSVLGLVEPQSSGLGGGGFLLWFDSISKNITTLDGREMASRHVTADLFQDEDGNPIKFYDAVVGGRSVGTPGIPALMLRAHQLWGKLEWSKLFNGAIELAKSGFIVSPRLSMLIEVEEKNLLKFNRTADYFFPEGKRITNGDKLKNYDYAQTLISIAQDKTESFYKGEIAKDIVKTVQSSYINPGTLDLIDLSNYLVKERPPVCIFYRNFNVCGMGPPSSGGITVGQILGILEPYELSMMGPNSVESWRLIGDASRLAFADRGRYIADSDYVKVPIKDLLDKNYLKNRSLLLQREKALKKIIPGIPTFDTKPLLSDDDSLEVPSTSHISIVDKYGNVLSMTTTIENTFGSKLMTKGGFLLNNEITDFSFRSHINGIPVANRISPKKRPRSSMAPTIILKNGKPYLVVGSPGGSRIIGYVAKSIIAHIDWGMDIQQSLSMPHLINRYGVYDLEKGTDAEAFERKLIAKGFNVRPRTLNSGLHAIRITESGLEGGADPRREGIALGN